MRRLALACTALFALLAVQGCLAVQAVGVAAGAAGLAVGAAGDVAEGAVRVVTPGGGDKEDDKLQDAPKAGAAAPGPGRDAAHAET